MSVVVMSQIGKFGLLGGNFKKPPQRKTRYVLSGLNARRPQVRTVILTCSLFRLNRSHEELTPLSWRDYFEHKRVVDLDGNKFTTYSVGNVESVLIVLLHGGGFNALTWSLFAVSIFKILRNH